MSKVEHEMVHHMGRSKWAETYAWECLDDETKKKLMLRKIDHRIMRKEAKIESLTYKVETLKMMREALQK